MSTIRDINPADSGVVSLPPFAVEDLADKLNADPEWRLTSRFWTTTLLFVSGADEYVLTIEDGRAVAFQPARGDPCPIRIGGSETSWRNLLEPVPKPYFQDFAAAAAHHDFACTGDLESFFAYYAAISRILVVMRTARASRR